MGEVFRRVLAGPPLTWSGYAIGSEKMGRVFARVLRGPEAYVRTGSSVADAQPPGLIVAPSQKGSGLERYHGFEIETLPPQVIGALGRQVVCPVIVYEGDDVLFSVSAGVSYTLSAVRGTAAEDLACELALRHAHGLIDLAGFERGQEYELTFGETWDPAAADSTTSDEEIRKVLLEAAERMLRSEASSSEVPFLDGEGLAQVMEVNSARLREQLVLMQTEGLVSAPATFGRGLTDGALRITSAGLAALRSLSDQTKRPGSGSEFRTVVFTDLVESTRVLAEMGDDAGLQLIHDVERSIEQLTSIYSGRLVKHLGDGSLLSFPSPRSALEFAIAAQRAMAARPLGLRIGMAAGEPIEEDDDIHGAVVVQASRISNLASVGEILVSDAIRQLLLGKGFSFESEGEHQLKGLDEPVRVWRASAIS